MAQSDLRFAMEVQDPELEKLHANRIATLKKEAEKRQVLQIKGHGEYREIGEGEFLGDVTASEKVICHFYHIEFYCCKIIYKHLKALAPKHVGPKFIKLDAENAPFFVTKLGVKTLPCVVLFSDDSWVVAESTFMRGSYNLSGHNENECPAEMMYHMPNKILHSLCVGFESSTDDIFCGYLYFHKAPNKEEFHQETCLKIKTPTSIIA